MDRVGREEAHVPVPGGMDRQVTGDSPHMTDDTVHQNTARTASDDDPRLAVLQAVVDRVTSWQDGADEATVRKELDDAVAEADVEVDDETRQRIVTHILDDTSHVDVKELLR
jgi:hypothetical protein